MISYKYIFFFFSSRRRHTRSTRDWSSDVCSSDLPPARSDGGDHRPPSVDGRDRRPGARDRRRAGGRGRPARGAARAERPLRVSAPSVGGIPGLAGSLQRGNTLGEMSTTLPGTTGVEQQDVDEARAFNAQLEALIATQPLVYTLAPEVSRRARREGKGIFPAPVFLEEARDIEIAGRGGPIKVRVIRPDRNPIGIYLHIHGGGWTFGAHDMQDAALKLLANETGLCAASIDYRLAPENPYPADRKST